MGNILMRKKIDSSRYLHRVAEDTSLPARDPILDGTVIYLNKVYKIYQTGDFKVAALRGITLSVRKGEFVAIMGSSGSGKSTLMGIIGCLDIPTAGEYYLDSIEVRQLDERQLSMIRNRKIGFIFQSFNLIPRTSALANIELPLAYAGIKPKLRRQIALASLNAVGLGARSEYIPNKLSGGQQQRVAIARAIATNPSLILADEPTGNLDSQSSQEVMQILSRFHRAGKTIVLITHEPDIAAYADRLIRISDGQLISDEAIDDNHWVRNGNMQREDLSSDGRRLRMGHSDPAVSGQE